MQSSSLSVFSLPDEQEFARARSIAVGIVQDYDLDLKGFTVYTEAATGPYRFTPCIAALAGAQVIAIAQDSIWGSCTKIYAEQQKISRQWGLKNAPRIVFEKCAKDLESADIITNTGHVRPINEQMISSLKPDAVVALMWETYEWRNDELDIEQCRANDVLVMGTDETRIGFLEYVPETLVKMLHSVSISVHGGTFLYLSSEPIAGIVVRSFAAWDAEVRCSGFIERPECPYFISSRSEEFLSYLKSCDAIICDERFDKRPLLGKQGLIDIDWLTIHCPGITIVNRHGFHDPGILMESNIACVPDAQPVAWHKPKATTAILGLRPVITLMTAGLKVGEAMARGRLMGYDTVNTARYAMAHSPAQDFLAPYNWIV